LPVQPLPFACSNYLNSKSDMPFSTKQIWGTPSEIKKATFGARPVQSRRQPLGRTLFNQEGNFWGVPCSIKKATFGARPI
jgi:hypothetical protein